MLIELAIGDAYGAAFEYASPQFVKQHNDLSSYYKHPRHGIKSGRYTDDTQMSLAIAEVIVSGVPWTAENLANKFTEAFHRDRRKGYARGFYQFLLGIKDGKEFLDNIRPDSDKSGAAMRATPIGIFKDIEEVKEKCRIQAAITHNTKDGINAALAAALTAHYFIYDLSKRAELGRFLESHVEGEWSKPWRGKVKSQGWMSVRASITALEESDSMSELLKRSISFTGDVDTVAAIALSAGSCSREIIQDLPPHLYEDLENGPFGYDYIAKLDRELLALKEER